MAKPFLRLAGVVAAVYVLFVLLVFLRQRSLLFFPSHAAGETRLTEWREGGAVVGYSREVAQPETVWLMLHGNAGQAADRDYVLPCLPPSDSLYVMEYPGYGARPGKPCRASFDAAAAEAYRALRKRHPGVPVGVLAESIGSGPACALVRLDPPPDKLVLVVPFDSLAVLAAEKFPVLPVKLLLRDRWDNAESLRGYRGPVEIFAASEDNIVPARHARSLAGKLPQARLMEIQAGHNDWAEPGRVRIRR